MKIKIAVPEIRIPVANKSIAKNILFFIINIPSFQGGFHDNCG